MDYLAAIEKGSDTQAWGVIVPDIPGTFSAGDTFEEALKNAQEAIVLQLTELMVNGEGIPAPSAAADLVDDKDYKGMIWAVISIPAELLDTKSERVNIMVPRSALRAIDSLAKSAGKSRSAYLVEAGLTANF